MAQEVFYAWLLDASQKALHTTKESMYRASPTSGNWKTRKRGNGNGNGNGNWKTRKLDERSSQALPASLNC